MRKVSVILALLTLAVIGLGSTTSFAAEKKVVLMWVGRAGMAKRVATGFLQRMREKAPNVEIVQHRELNNMQQGEQLFTQSETSSDGIVFLRSNGAEFLGRLSSPPKVPCFIGGCNNPQELGAIKNLNAPEGMITGVTYFIPFEKRFQVIKQLFPNIKSVGLLLQKGHPAAVIDQQGTKEQCARNGIAYHEVAAENLKQLVDGTKQLSGKVDVFILSSTALVLDNLMSLLVITNPSKTPIFSYAADRAEKGATAELAADDEKLGRLLAESVVDVVVDKKPISQVPVKMDPNPKLIINEGQMQVLGLKFPDAILKSARLVK
jgi:putative tryptophan/tyrosine transport system substrate-binding protein